MSDKSRLRRQIAALLGFLATSYVVSMLGSLPIIGRTAGLLLLPYISWIVFPSSLNFCAAASN